MNKAETREKTKRLLWAQPAEERLRRSREIISKLVKLKEYADAKTVLAYVSMDEEVSTRELIPKAISEGKCVVVPAVSHDGKSMTLHEIKSLEELEPGYRGINEPKDRRTCFECGRLDLAVVPGLAFDKGGNRLGRGKGMFDRLFERAKCPKVALAFDIQILDSVPVEKHDSPVDMIVTESRVLRAPKWVAGFR